MRGRFRSAALLAAVSLGGCLHVPEAALPTDGSAQTDDLTPATPLAEVVQRRHVQPLDPGSPTPLLEQAMAELAKTDPRGRFRGITYSLTTDNALAPNWIVQTPDVWGRRSADVGYFPLACKGACDADFRLPFCRSVADCPAPGATCGHLRAFDAQPDLVGRRLCLGASDAVVDRFYRPVADAQHAVDVTLLQPAPDFRFLSALRNAVTMLARSHRRVTLRFLVGQYPPDGSDPKALLSQLVRDAQHVPGARLTVYSAAMRSCTATPDCASLSWNHAKIVAVDGKTAVVGGHNMYTPDYLLDHPVHDLTMQVSGGAARDAHHFADRLWEYVCDHDHGSAPVASFVYRSGPDDIGPGCLERIDLPRAPLQSVPGVPILASARLASGITDHFADQDDLARDLIFGAARHRIVVAQQDVAFQLPGQAAPLYPEETLQTWAEFLLAGRGDVFLVLSNLGAEDPDGGNYSNGVPLAALRKSCWRSRRRTADCRKRS